MFRDEPPDLGHERAGYFNHGQPALRVCRLVLGDGFLELTANRHHAALDVHDGLHQVLEPGFGHRIEVGERYPVAGTVKPTEGFWIVDCPTAENSETRGQVRREAKRAGRPAR